jgi:hypothetical protein
LGTKGEAAGWRERFIGLREDLLLDNSRGNRDLPTEAGVLLGYARKKETLCCGPETSVREKGGVRSPETERGGRCGGRFGPRGKGKLDRGRCLAEISWLLSLFFFFSILLSKAFSKDNLNANKLSQKKTASIE